MHSPTDQNNSSQPDQNSHINEQQQQQFNSMSRSTNPNQVAFNYGKILNKKEYNL